MFVVSTYQSISLVFTGRKDLENVISHLQMYADDHTEADEAIRVYTISDVRIAEEETRELTIFLKKRFTSQPKVEEPNEG